MNAGIVGLHFLGLKEPGSSSVVTPEKAALLDSQNQQCPEAERFDCKPNSYGGFGLSLVYILTGSNLEGVKFDLV